MRAGKATVALALGFSLSGCWLQPGYGSGHTWSNPGERELTAANVASLAPLWSRPIESSSSEPIVSGDHVYVTRNGFDQDQGTIVVDAVEAGSGATAWSRTLATSNSYFSSPERLPAVVVGDELWAGYTYQIDTRIGPICWASRTRLDLATGALVGEEPGFGTGAVPAGAIVAQEHRTPYGNGSCEIAPPTLVVRDSGTLATNWSFAFPEVDNSNYYNPEHIGPTVAGGRVFVFNRTTLYAFAADGCGDATCPPVWTATEGSGAPVGVPAVGRDGTVLALYDHGSEPPGGVELVAYAAATGAVRWRARVAAADGFATDVTMAATASNVYLGSTLNLAPNAGARHLEVFAASGCGATTCEPLWTATTGDAGSLFGRPATPVVAGGLVYLTDSGGIHVFPAAGCGAASCAEIASIPVDGIPLLLTVSNGRLYVTTYTQQLIAYAPT